MNKKDNNLLEFIPYKNLSYIYDKEEESNNITIIIKRNSKFDKLILKIFRKAHKELYVHLDEIGSFIWRNIDGKKTVLNLCEGFMKEYNVEQSEAINRTVYFLKILKNNKFIKFTANIKK
ncbi:PqqD family protein [Clostridium massiliodielmoense]|uniref:PqqD family protein n=1 Tax=Clostridium massiliodielmoense TaxID=1776385 RepID=UPI000A2724CF|nr:PqqD family protein [Clostridium massiliodielmoense]